MKPNIVMFIADQMRSDSLAHLGNPASLTPNLDTIVKEELGVSFKNAYCQNPVCSPSRISFLTGLYPHTLGHRTISYLQNDFEPNILKEMKENGYEVIWIGRNDVLDSRKDKSEYCDLYISGINGDMQKMKEQFINDETQNFIKEKRKGDNFYSFYYGEVPKNFGMLKMDEVWVKSLIDYLKNRNSPKPFFVYCTIGLPHPPYGIPEPYFSKIDRKKLPKRRPNINLIKNKSSMLYGIFERQNLKKWSEEKWDELRAVYLGMVNKFDEYYGDIVKVLKEKKLFEDTNIFVFSDHGDYTGDYGIAEKVQNSFENPVVNVPLLFKPSKNIKIKSSIIEKPVELIDIPATLADIAGFQLSYTQFGHSLIKRLNHEIEFNDVVFSEGGRIHGETYAMEKGHGPDSEYWPRLETQCQEGPEHTKAIMCRKDNLKYIYRLYELDELYDLNSDPHEIFNLIKNENYKEQIAWFKLRILDWMVETGDFVPSRKDKR
ncbi:arylsulfatase [Williamsoniiplasma somnilux]|uniref:Arylsulfatase n=1 Tax=Williamsoniiplasma somnilux TaxID=215578 RepID=A0A2K8P1F6_9MOLU|nr:sulfatase-like hydrolase/transferase [Williamsoniiplasma somnilux]ATZ18733.1 arylsulfatase [Williamsoniiplasma somnilux]